MQPFMDDYGHRDPATGTSSLSTSFTSLTSSIIYVGELFGALTAAPINDYYGRKAVFFTASISIIGGGIAQVADQGIMGVIVLGRILIGHGIGNFTVTCLLYIGEIAPQQIRGPALMSFQLLQSCSQLVASGITQGTSTISSDVSYRIPMGLLILLPTLMLLGLLIIPESPAWYMSRQRVDEAKAALHTINRSTPSYDPTADILALQEATQMEMANEQEASWSSLVKDPVERRKALYACGSMCAQQINGIVFFYSYGVVFAQSIGMSDPFTISLITNVLQVVSVAVSVVLSKRIPRRANLLTTTTLMFIAYIVIGGISIHNITNQSATAIVVISYVVIVAFNFGLGPLAYTMASEVAVGCNRNKIMSCSIVTFFFTTWLVSFTAPYLYYDANLGPMLAFIYAGTTMFSLAYIWFCVGETSGRSLAEVSLFFQNRVPVRQWKDYQPPSLTEATIFQKDTGEEGLSERIEVV
jgi:sugar porter (SP) family MFS transporter